MDEIKVSNKVLNIIFAFTAFVILVGDQLSKYIINRQPQHIFPIEIIPNFFYLTRITNSGAAFGLFQGKINIFIIISIIAIILIIVLKIKMNIRSVFYNIALGFILGGAVGNLIDRVILREVTDFIHIVFWAVFNVADSFIVIGFGIIIIIIIRSFFKKGAVK
jgi:signal peptidase II